MDIGSVKHKGLRRFIERDDASGLPPAYVDKIRKMLSFLENVGDLSELRQIPAWHAHMLAGDRKGTWALHVSPNWRMTFRVDQVGSVIDLDLEDYH